MARVKQEEPRNTEETDLIARAKKYAFLKSQLDYLEKEQKALRTDLFSTIEEQGEEDSKGNLVLELPEEVDGYVSVMKQRRVSRKVNEEIAFQIIEELGLEEELIETKKVINEDALMAALYADKLTEEQIEEMYPQSVVWALVMNKR
jgi:hypothetical protein